MFESNPFRFALRPTRCWPPRSGSPNLSLTPRKPQIDCIAATRRVFSTTRQVVLLVLFKSGGETPQHLTESMRHIPLRLYFDAVSLRVGRTSLSIFKAMGELRESLLKSPKISTASWRWGVGLGRVGEKRQVVLLRFLGILKATLGAPPWL